MRAFWSCPVDLEIDQHGHNAVMEIPFELAKPFQKKSPLWNAERLRFVRRLAKSQPNATLRELCEQMNQEQAITVSISSMSRTLKRLGHVRKVRALIGFM